MDKSHFDIISCTAILGIVNVLRQSNCQFETVAFLVVFLVEIHNKIKFTGRMLNLTNKLQIDRSNLLRTTEAVEIKS